MPTPSKPKPTGTSSPNWTPDKEIQWLEPGQLLLDTANPRIAEGFTGGQLELIKLLYDREGLDDLADSISRNGYFMEEPLVAIPGKENKYTVVEGNRRLATVKLFLDERARKFARVVDWPNLTSTKAKTLERLPVILYERRSEVQAFIGFRHITGIKKWGYFARSRYVKQLVDSGTSLTEIEKLLGDRGNESKRLYQVSIAFDQVEENDAALASRVQQNASLMEVALSQQGIKEYLDIDKRLPTHKIDQVIPRAKEDNFIEVVEWIFGSDSPKRDPVISESRDIGRKLAKVLKSDSATKYLRDTRNLDASLERVPGEEQYLIQQLTKAKRALQEADKILPQYQEHPDVQELLEFISQAAQRLKQK